MLGFLGVISVRVSNGRLTVSGAGLLTSVGASSIPKVMVDSPAPATIADEAVVDAITTHRANRKAGFLSSPGRVNSELIQSLVEAFPPDVIHGHIAACMSATVVTKGGTVLPDNRTRLAALQLLLAYTEGKPVERQQVETLIHNSDPVADIEERLAKSPSLRRSLAATLAKVENQTVV